jgi:hypothetical protein
MCVRMSPGSKLWQAAGCAARSSLALCIWVPCPTTHHRMSTPERVAGVGRGSGGGEAEELEAGPRILTALRLPAPNLQSPLIPPPLSTLTPQLVGHGVH